MFYKNEFVGNYEELLYGDYREATSHEELQSLIEKLSRILSTFHQYKAPDVLKEAYQHRLMEVTQYYLSVGGTL